MIVEGQASPPEGFAMSAKGGDQRLYDWKQDARYSTRDSV